MLRWGGRESEDSEKTMSSSSASAKENQPLLAMNNNSRVVSSPEQSGGDGGELSSREKGGDQEQEVSQWGKLSLTAGVACLQMAATMGLITVGAETTSTTKKMNSSLPFPAFSPSSPGVKKSRALRLPRECCVTLRAAEQSSHQGLGL